MIAIMACGAAELGCQSRDSPSEATANATAAPSDIHLSDNDIKGLCQALSQKGVTSCTPEDPPGQFPELAAFESRSQIAGVTITEVPPGGVAAESNAAYVRGKQSLPIYAPCADVAARLMQPDGWTWWRGGIVHNVTTSAQGGIQFDLNPITRPFEPVLTMTLGTPSRPDSAIWIIPITFQGAFVGPGSLRLTQSGTECTLVHTWDGVRGAALPPELDAKLHFLATSGQFPFEYGTGFVGLAYDLEHDK
jgi:hypothetical protein